VPDVPDVAVRAAAKVLFRQYESEYSAGHLTWRDFTVPAREILGAAMPAIDAGIRSHLAAEIDPARLDQLADWFDDDDKLKMWLYEQRPDVFPRAWNERGNAVQTDLRQWAKLLRGARADDDHGR
jgi:hypothetical protein